MRVAISWAAPALMAVSAASACASKPAAVTPETDPRPVVAFDAGATDAGPLADAGPTVSESEARAWLTAQLRAVDLRVRHDVAVAFGSDEVVLDGWDPQRRIGFEYIASSQGDPPVPAAWRAALAASDARVLIVEETDAHGLERAGARFVAQVIKAREKAAAAAETE